MSRGVSPSAALRELIGKAQECFDNKQFAAAGGIFLKALELSPDNPRLCFMAGNAVRRTGDFELAAKLYRRATDTRPDFFAAHCNLAAAMRELCRFDDAIAPLEKALSLRPDSVEVRLQLADLYIRQSRIDDARKMLLESIARRHDSAEALNGLGNCAAAQGDLNAAKEYYHRALLLRPDYADAHYNLGTIMRQWEFLDEAVACFLNAIRFQPGRLPPIVDLGEAYQLLGEMDRSEECFREALKIDPGYQPARHNLLLSMQYNHRHDPHTVLSAHREWGRYAAPVNLPPKWRNDRSAKRRLIVGYLSPDFCNHPAAAFLEPMLQYHDRINFEIHCYAQTINRDDRTERFRQLAFHWNSVKTMNDREVAEMIRNDRVDLLFDTAGHFKGNRLGVFALRAAPLQISGIGYPGPSGCAAMDYRLSDDIVDPPDEEAATGDTPLRIQNCFCCYRPPDNLPPVGPLPAAANSRLTFGSLHTTARLNEAVVKLWSAVLHAISHSRLLICRRTLTQSVIKRLSEWFRREGIPLSRIEFSSTIPDAGHLAVYNEIDLSLDTLPWSGHTTACESLIMGVPMITLRGDRPAGRTVCSILTSAGLSEYCAMTREEFIAIAVDAASNPEELASTRAKLREKVLSSPLCDGRAYMKNLESQLRLVWRKWCESS